MIRKTITVLFCDLKGSTTLGESLDSETLRAVISRYFERIRGVIEGHGGQIEKFIGDAVMAVFGLQQQREDDALRAVRCAAEMKRALVELNRDFARTWGITLRTGPASTRARSSPATPPGESAWSATRSTLRPGSNRRHPRTRSCSAPRPTDSCATRSRSSRSSRLS